jgi:hypothetical protein
LLEKKIVAGTTPALAGNIAIVLLGRICLTACIGRFIISKVETKPFTGIGANSFWEDVE